MPTLTLPLKPFTVPNFVILDYPSPGRSNLSSYPIAELTDDVINKLLDEFRANLWAKVHRDRCAATPAIDTGDRMA